MVKIIQDFISKGNNNRPGNYMKPLYIKVHNTANTSKGANAASHAAFVKRSSTGVSWHYTVDENVIYQHLPLNENGWHAGDGRGTGNMKSIGIKICENADGNFEKAVPAHARSCCRWHLWTKNKSISSKSIEISNKIKKDLTS